MTANISGNLNILLKCSFYVILNYFSYFDFRDFHNTCLLETGKFVKGNSIYTLSISYII